MFLPCFARSAAPAATGFQIQSKGGALFQSFGRIVFRDALTSSAEFHSCSRSLVN
jgi:hypothetical protein